MNILPKGLPMKNFLLSITLMAFLCVTGFSYADSPAMPIPKVTSSEWNNIYFTMIPEQIHFEKDAYDSVVVDKPAFGKAYKLKENGESELLWEVSGWYAFRVFISNDGQYLVRMGNWANGHKPAVDDLAVAFYKNGEELKSYSTSDLVLYPEKVESSVSHYVWKAKDREYPRMERDNKFKIKTIDGFIYTFDITTGEITDTEEL